MIRMIDKTSSTRRYVAFLIVVTFAIMIGPRIVKAQNCSSGTELDAASKGAINSAATQYLNMSKNGDVAGLKANAIPAITGDFGSIEQAVVTNKQYLAEASPTISGTYLLDASDAKAPLAPAGFSCGRY